MDKRCADCKHYQPLERFDDTMGDCRVNPPVADDRERAVWPMVDPDDWCSRFEIKVTSERAKEWMAMFGGEE